MFVQQTRKGVKFFETREEWAKWKKQGLNRFSVIGELEEVEVIEPAPYAFVVYAIIDDDGQIQFFDSIEEIDEYMAGEPVEIYKYTKEV